jgi:hypothetical protein
MASYKERVVIPSDFSRFAAPGFKGAVVTNDVTRVNLGDIGAADTFTLTPTRVDLATAGAATGAITFQGAGGQAAVMQSAIRALGGIYADATVVFSSAELYDITVFGGYNVTWAVTNPTTFTPGGTVETTPGAVVYAKQVPIGRFAEVKKLVFKNFNENALVVAITDADAKTVFSATLDTSTAAADAPLVKLLATDGVAGEDGAGAVGSAASGVFRGPLNVSITTNAPTNKAQLNGIGPVGRLSITITDENVRVRGARRIIKRTSGARAALSGTFGLGVPIAKVKRIRLKASADTTVAPTLTDADGLVIYTKTSTDYTAGLGVFEQLSHEGFDQANNAVADTLDVIAKSPITISGSGLGSGTFLVELYVEP